MPPAFGDPVIKNARLGILKALSPLCPMPQSRAACPADIAASFNQLLRKDAVVEKISQDPRYLAAKAESSRVAIALSACDKAIGYGETVKQLREADEAVGVDLGKLRPAIYDTGSHLLVAKHSAQDRDNTVSAEEILDHMMSEDATVRERVVEVRSKLAQQKGRTAGLRIIPQLFIFAREAIR